jgi:hypothetical protein
MKRLGVLTSPESVPMLRKYLEEASRRLDIGLLWAEHNSNDFTQAFALLETERPDALYVTSSGGAFAHRQLIVDFAHKIQLPATYPARSSLPLVG